MSCWTRSRRSPVASASAKSAARSNVLRTSARRPARIAPIAIAVAMCDLPTPGGPISRTPLCVSTKRALANSTIFAFGIFALKLQSKSASVFIVVMAACLSRRAKSRSARRASSSSTRSSRNSRCGNGAASACATRPGRASTMPERRRWRRRVVNCGFIVRSPPRCTESSDESPDRRSRALAWAAPGCAPRAVEWFDSESADARTPR